MKTIVVGFSHNNKIGSRLISWFLRRKFSHTYFKFQEPWYADYTISQATGHGISYMSETRFLENNCVVCEYTLEISDALFLEIANTCHQNAGVNYGYLQLVGVFLARLLSRIGLRVNKNPINDGIICSEWLYYILKEIYGDWTDKDPNLVDPVDVQAFLQSKFNK